MKILIIGSEGFIGRNCVSFFSGKAQEVFACDIVDKSSPGYFCVSAQDPDFDPVFQKINPDVCINASGSADVGSSIKDPDTDFRLNVKNVEKILQSIKKYSPDCRLINFSSASVYGNPKHLPVSESAVLDPLSPYGRHKLRSEVLLKEYHDKYRLRTCSMRVFSAYGPGLRKQIFWDVYKKSTQGKKIILFGTGKESRDFIFIDDLVRAIDCIIRSADFSGESINVSSGVETSIRDAATLLLSFLGNDHSVEFSGEEKKGDPKNWRADITILKKLGFVPFVTFEEGIKKYAEWLKEQE